MRIQRVYIDGDPLQEVTLCPLGDVQWAGDREDIAFDHLQRHIAKCLSQPHPLFIGMGDYVDFASPSNREALQQARVYDNARKVIQDATRKLVEEAYELIYAPTTAKWVGLVQGHHHFSVGGQDSDEYLCHLLQAPFLEEMGVVVIKWRTGNQLHGEVVAMAVHGDGYSVFPWGPLNKLYRFAPNIHADILLMGHHTKKAHTDHDQLVIETPEDGPDHLAHRPCHLVGTGGWGKGYVLGKPTYVSKAMYSPVALGQPIIHIRPRFDDTTHPLIKRWEPVITVES